MIAFLVRSLGLVIFAAAFVAFVADGVKSLAADAIVVTPFGQTWAALHPQSLAAVQTLVRSRLHAYLWDPVMTTVLIWPTFSVGGVIGILLMLAGARRRRPRDVV